MCKKRKRKTKNTIVIKIIKRYRENFMNLVLFYVPEVIFFLEVLNYILPLASRGQFSKRTPYHSWSNFGYQLTKLNETFDLTILTIIFRVVLRQFRANITGTKLNTFEYSAIFDRNVINFTLLFIITVTDFEKARSQK